MLDREICIRFTLNGIFKRAWFAPVLTVGVFLLIMALMYVPWSSVFAPAWVQAVGSVIAILVAAWAALHSSESQLRASESAEERRYKVVARALFEIAIRGSASARMLQEWLGDESQVTRAQPDFIFRQMSSELRRAQQIRLMEMPAPELIDKLLELVFLIGELVQIAEEMTMHGHEAQVRAYLEDVTRMLDELVESLRD